MEPGERIFSVVVISMGRPDCLNDITCNLNAQSRLPDRIVFVVPQRDDVPPELATGKTSFTVTPEIVISAQGTCRQRNVGIKTLGQKTGIIAFFDDDYLPAPNALDAIELAFDTFGPDVAGMSGHLIADGISGPGLSVDQANQMIAKHATAQSSDFLTQTRFSILKETIGLYGCNMALRANAIGHIQFDEGLPLYAWQEDVDFAHRVAKSSGTRMIRTDAFAGVHRGVKNGRETRGIRLGYSQIANNWYLWKNSALPGPFAARVAAKNILANHIQILKREPGIDRIGRARGNWLALIDILRGRADPQRIRDL